MGEPAIKQAGYEDVLNAPGHTVAEVVDGKLSVQPRPASVHAVAGSALGFALGPPFSWKRGGPGGWVLIDEPELHLGADIVVPDMAGWRRERMPRAPRAPFFTLAPDWICEVLSPSTRRWDRVRKLPMYAREKVAHAWLVDPIDKTLEVLRLVDGHWMLVGTHSGEDVIRAEPFDAIELELALLWDDVEPAEEP